MPIRWSALELDEAMDEVEKLINEAEPFLAEAESKARKATSIAYLPQYLSQRLHRLVYAIEYSQAMRDAIAKIRQDIPKGAIETERQSGRQGRIDLETAHCFIKKRNDFWKAVDKEMRL